MIAKLIQQSLNQRDRALEALDAAQEILKAWAEIVANAHWDAVARQGKQEHENARYGVRVDRDAHVVTIEWFLVKTVTAKTGKKAKRHECIARGKGWWVPIHKFPKAKGWELEEIERSEAEFALIRQYSNLLADMTKKVTRNEKFFETLNAKLRDR